MGFPIQLSFMITIVCVLLLVYYIWKGYHNGLILELVITVSLLICVVVAYFVSKGLSTNVFLVSAPLDTGISEIDEMAHIFVNQSAWFLIVFVVSDIVLRITRKYFRKFNDITIIGTANQWLGRVLAGCKGLIYIVLIIMLFSSPIIKNGEEALKQSGLWPVHDILEEHMPVVGDALEAFEEANAWIDSLSKYNK